MLKDTLSKSFNILKDDNITYSKYVNFNQPNYKIIIDMWNKYKKFNKIL